MPVFSWNNIGLSLRVIRTFYHNLLYHLPTLKLMEDYTVPLMALLFCVVAAIAFISKIFHKRVPKFKFPPGPKPWPIIGHLHLLGSLPHQSLHVLSQIYGEIMQLKFGMCPVLIVSSPEMAKQFLKVHDVTFASRPPLAAGKYTSYNYSDMGWSPYGPYWRQARKIYLNEVFRARKLESFNHILVEETRTFLSRLCSVSGKPIILRDHLFRYTLSSISRITLGDIYVCESEGVDDNFMSKLDELRELLDEWFVLAGAFNIGDWIPWLASLDLQGYVKRMKAFAKKSDKFLDYVISDHLAKKASKKDFTGRDFVDALLDMTEDSKLEVKLTTERVKALLQNLLAAGTDTSAAAVEWSVHEMLRQPLNPIINKAKEELHRVVGRNRWVEESDFSQLPYIDAIAMESMRLHPLATLLAPHYATENCTVAGYDVSKGTTVFINTWSLGRDPKSWDRPEEFLPERFVGKDIDMLGSNYAFLPFGSGRRMCPGYSLGLKTVRLVLANLLHGFDLKLVEGMKPEDISTEEQYGLTTHPKEPLSIVLEPVLPAHLY